MTQLILKRASASRPSGEWSDDDYDALADGVPILLQKSLVIAARLLPRSLGTVLTIRSLRSGDAGSNEALTHDIG